MTAKNNVPRVLLIAAGLVMAGSVGIAAAGSMMHGPASAGTVVASRNLRFADLPDGQIQVSDADDGATIKTVEFGQENFMRAMVRGMAQRRIMVAGDAGAQQEPFRLTAWEGGRLTFEDPQTGRSVDLEAFGRTNEGTFAELLNMDMPQR